jgi:hypothetical protein
MDKTEVDKIWKEIKENHRKLDDCIGHDFSIVLDADKPYKTKYQCTKCKGTVEWREKHWYQKGIEHAKNNTV